MSRSTRLLALACVPALFLPVHSAEAAARRARLTIDVKIEGTELVAGNGNNRTSGKFREGYTLVTYLETDGELQQYNTKDPEYAQKMMGLSQNVQRQVNAAQAKPQPKKMNQQELQAYVQKKQAGCGAERSTQSTGGTANTSCTSRTSTCAGGCAPRAGRCGTSRAAESCTSRARRPPGTPTG